MTRSVGELSLALEDTFSDRVPNIVEEREKLNWLADWAVRDLRITSPTEMLNFMSYLDQEASRRWPKRRFIDRVYMFAREQKALKEMRGV